MHPGHGTIPLARNMIFIQMCIIVNVTSVLIREALPLGLGFLHFSESGSGSNIGLAANL